MPEQKWRICFYKIAESRAFEIISLSCVVLNTLFLAVKWVGMSEEVIFYCLIINYVFSALFAIEAIIKITGFGCFYFKDNWNQLDFFIVITSIVSIISTSVF
jgi:hypothetical protein